MESELPVIADPKDSKSWIVYVIECIACGKLFERPKLDLDLGEHQDPKTGYLCYSYGKVKEMRVAP